VIVVPKGWSDFQHYKDRSPPWIKLHKGLLDNYEFQSLPIASRALAPMLWLLASDNDRGEIDAAPKKLAFRLRMTEREVSDALKPLIDNGFFLSLSADSDALAERKRLADLETEAEKRKEEAEQRARAFEAFWAAYPKKEGRKDAEAAWAKVDAPLAVLLAAVAARAKTEDWMKAKGQFVPLPATYLRGKRWEDESAPPTTHPASEVFVPPKTLSPVELAANKAKADQVAASLGIPNMKVKH
jgi:DNA-binding MarR family transcriptional regulator